MRSLADLFVVPAGVCLLAGASLPAQSGAHRRSDAQVLKTFRSVVARARLGTVRVTSKGRQVALGAVVGRGAGGTIGHVVTKASELGPELRCELADGRRLPAKLVARDGPSDLALLEIEAGDLVPIPWQQKGKAVLVPGSWVATPGTAPAPAAVGIVSSGLQRRVAPGRAALAIEFTDDRWAARVAHARKGSVAAALGLEAGDTIEGVDDGWEIHSPRSFQRFLRRRSPGDRVTLHVKRAGRLLDIEADVAADRRGPRHSQERFWGPLSNVRVGFSRVLPHDTVLRPNQCGGPVVGLNGAVIGINIARSGRVETLALPAAVVQRVLAELLAKKRRKV